MREARRGRVRQRAEPGLLEVEVLDLPLCARRVRGAARGAEHAAAREDGSHAAARDDTSPEAALGAGAGLCPEAPALAAVDPAALEWWRARSVALGHRAVAEEQDDALRGVAAKSCGCLGMGHPLRRWCLGLIGWPWFDRVVLGLIMLNSILLGAQDPRGDEPPWAVVSDLAFNVLFTLEVAVKVVALGAWGGEAAYFRDAWNRFDFVTVCAGWLPYALCVGLARNPSHCFTGKGASGATLNITFLRVVKVVKVLKTVQRIPGMRCLFVSLFKAAPLLTQVIEVLLFIFFVFGAIGVQLFMGRLRQRCVDAETHAPAGDHVCSEAPAWGGHRCGRGERCTDRDARGKAFDNPDGLNKYVSFDNILLGFATVLSTMSLEGWSGTLFALMDALGPVVVVYFVLLILIGSFFAVNLIVAVIYQAYVSIEATEAPVRLADALTRFDDDAADAAAAAAEVQSRRSRGPPARDRGARQDRDAALARVASPARRFVLRWWWRLRDFCHGVADSDAFSAFYTCCIAVNTLVLMAEHKSQARAQSLFTCRANVLLTYLFIGEMLVKMLGTDYVFDAEDGGFNTFDAIITVGSVVDIIASQGVSGRGCDRVRVDVRRGEGGGDSAALQALRVGRVLRLVRILRSLRIVRAWKSMSHILSAVVRSGPALFNFSCLLVMFSWVYALAGMQMYAGRFVGSAGRKAVRPRTNFDSLDGALITVFVVVSGENWDEVLDLAYRANGAVGLFFVTSMYWLGNFVVLNMFLAILLSNFDTAVGGSETLYDQLEQSNEVTNVLKASLRACDHAATSAGLRMASTPRLGRCAGRARRLAADALAAVARPAARCAQVLRAAAGGGAAKRVRDASARILNTSTRVLDVSARAGGGPAARAGDDEQQRAFNAAVDAATQEIAGQMQSELRTSMCRRGRREYFDCFSGSVAVDWLLEAAFAVDTAGAEALGQKLLDKRLISKAEGSAKRTFRNLVARARRTQLAAQHASAAQRAAAARRASGSPESPTPRRLFPSARSFTTPRGSPALGSPPWDRPGGSPLAVPETPPPWPPPPPGVFDEDRFADDHQLYRFCARHAHRLHLVGDPETMKIQRAARDVRQRFARRRRLLGSGASLGLFSADSAVRRACVALVIHPAFDATVGLLIVVSSILLAAESPDQNESTAAFAHADIALTLCFNVEFIVKSVASGFFVYLSSGWNTLDFAIVMVSNASIALAGADLSYLKALRALRALRPLRMIQRYPAMKTVVDALMEALPDLLNVGLVVLGFFCIFSVAGGTLFRGSLDWCHVGPKNSNECARAGCDYAAVDDDDWAYAEHFGRYEVGKKQCRAWWRSRGEAGGGVPWSALPAEFVSEGALGSSPLRAEWKAMLPNYDNLGQGLLALFEVATLEGWPSIMYAAMDVTVDPERHPRRNASPAHAVFYVIFVVIGSFFVMNMFVGVVVHKFQLSKERTDGANIMVTDGQRAFVGKIKALLDTGRPSRLRLPNEPWRRKLFYLVVSEKFEVCVIAIITLNMVAISLQHYDQSPRWTFVLDTVGNTAFTSLFAAEMALKMLGLGAEQYAADNWNRFDAFIVATSLIDTATSFSGSALLEFNLSLFRILRLVRVIKLVNVNQGLKALLRSLVVSLPSLMNVGSLLLLLIFVYACIGMNLYHRVERAGAVTQHVNFETFGFSMLALFRCLTGEDWWALMQQVVDDANRISAYAFFPSFVVLGNFILLNLCVAVILEAFAEDSDSDSERGRCELRDHVATFKAVWLRHDVDDSLFIPAYRIVALLQNLPAPLGLATEDARAAAAAPGPRGSLSPVLGRGSLSPGHSSLSSGRGSLSPVSGRRRLLSPSARGSSFTSVVPRKADDEAEIYRLTPQQRDLIEHVRSLRIKVNEAGDLFYLDVLMAVVFRAGDFRAAEHLGGIEDDSTMELNILLLRSMDRRLRDQMRKHAFRHDLPELDLTHTTNAAVTLQEIFRAKSQSERQGLPPQAQTPPAAAPPQTAPAAVPPRP